MKSRLRTQGGVANPRDSTSYRCGLRLALGANASISLCAVTYGTLHERPEIMRMHSLPGGDVDVLLDTLAMLIEPVNMNYLWRPQLRDPKDDMVLETALNAGADALVTFNQRDFEPAARHFELRLLSPAACLALLEKTP